MSEVVTRSQIIDQLAILSINLPAKSNALSLEVLNGLEAFFDSLTDRNNVEAVILQAEGKTFSAGHDFSELFEISEEESQKLFQTSLRLMQLIREAPIPVVAKVHGPAVGAGCQLALMCDFVITSREAYFQTAGGAHGWFCFSPMATLIDKLSPRRALEMLFTGQKIYADTALEWGLINRVVSESDLDHETVHFVKELTKGDQEMLALGKKAFYQMLDMSLDARLKRGCELMVETCRTEAAQKRIRGSKLKRIT